LGPDGENPYIVSGRVSISVGVRGISSIVRRLRRFVDDLKYGSRGRPRAPVALITVIVVLFAVFIAGGGIYDILDNPPAILPGPNGWLAVHPYAGEQTLNESILSMVFMVFIVAGLYSAYSGTQVTYDSKKATSMLVMGIALILIGLSGSHYLIILKRIVARG